MNKRSELLGKVDSIKPDLIGISEVWMKECFMLQGYHPAFRKDRAEGHQGGGVMLLIRDHLQVTECVELNSLPFAESVWCHVNLSRSRRLLVGICYRSPNSTNENNHSMLEMLRAMQGVRADGILLMGDFNFPSINWEEGTVNDTDISEAAKFFETTQDLFLYQHVKFPTRFRDGQSPSCLDLVFSDQEHVIDDIEGGEPLGKSDHITVTWRYMYEESPAERGNGTNQSHKYNYKKGRYAAMSNALKSVDWSCLETMNVEESWEYIKEVINECTQIYIPLIGVRKKNRAAPWWSSELTRAVKRKYKAWQSYALSRSPHDFHIYANQRNQTTATI